MSLPLVVTAEAEDDIASARQWYEDQREGLGDEFVLCIEEALERIRRPPLSGREVVDTVRKIIVRRFPYGVFYRVDPDQIGVIAVYHAKRDPRGWQSRL
jgi:toxin ParE1/3/4